MKKTILLIAFIFCFSAAFAATLQEKSFKEMGYDDFVIEGADQEKCAELLFAKDSNTTNAGHYTIFSLKAVFSPTREGNAKITVFLNDSEKEVAEINARDFLNEFERILLPGEKLKETNKLTICGKTSSTITKILVSNESMIGTYLSPDFSQQGAFEVSVENLHPILNQEVTAIVTLRNDGSEKTNVELNYKKLFVELKAITFLKGESEFKGELKPGQQIKLEYIIRFNKDGPVGLPAAIATYTNAFGESEKIVSNYLTVDVIESPETLKPVLLIQKPTIKINEKTTLILAVKNSGQNPQYNISLTLKPAKTLSVDGTLDRKIDSIQPGETKYFEFQASSAIEGKQTVECSLRYLDANAMNEKCEPIDIIVGEENTEGMLIAGLVLLLIGAIIYLFIYLK